ncbi:hypothetical protein [Mesorhizobium sp. B2-8-9]|uniref:hypothetical protein n=1 Tax=Mesorhizobium sp. B2-8-9 TaxID=2589899 RepID=UPI00112B9DE0|nr:hypothetical protein [Mesorhizobium sp. B2-8-9]TPI78484.1 hypothetical protein FJ423_16350 [Mesorhizobium sp. B2-8-9]
MPSTFSLPRLQQEGPGQDELYTFNRSALSELGFYAPGGVATVNDPVWTGTKYPFAVAVHELAHQYLMINTTYGVLTQLVSGQADKGLISRYAMTTCYQAQWAVQELTALYAEFAALADDAPDQFEVFIADLPSARLGQPPYREIFDRINSWLPLQLDGGKESNNARKWLVVLIAFAAMNSDCIRRACEHTASESAFMAAISDTPNDRFERLVRAIDDAKALPALVEEARRLFAEMPKKRAPGMIFQRLRQSFPDTIAWEDENIAPLVQRLVEAWPEWFEAPPIMADHAGHDPLPGIAFGNQRSAQGREEHPPKPLADGLINDRFRSAALQKHGVLLEIAVPDVGLVYARIGAYLPERGDEPWPSADFTDAEAATLPPDIGGLVSAPALMEQLRGFPTVPRIISFVERVSFQRFCEIPRAREAIENAFLICHLTNLSKEAVEHAIKFEGLPATHFFIVRLNESVNLGCIVNPDNNYTSVMIRVESDFGTKLFSSICDELGLQCHPSGFERQASLLKMMDGLVWHAVDN